MRLRKTTNGRNESCFNSVILSLRTFLIVLFFHFCVLLWLLREEPRLYLHTNYVQCFVASDLLCVW